MSGSTDETPDPETGSDPAAGAGADVDESRVPAPIERVRSVTPPYRGRPDREMDVFGWSMFLALLLLLLPFLPIVLVVWAIGKFLDVVVGR